MSMESQIVLIYGGVTIVLLWHVLGFRRIHNRLSPLGRKVSKRLEECLVISSFAGLLDYFGMPYVWTLYLALMVVEISLILSAIRAHEEVSTGRDPR
jgi:hypothetical protein